MVERRLVLIRTSQQRIIGASYIYWTWPIIQDRRRVLLFAGRVLWREWSFGGYALNTTLRSVRDDSALGEWWIFERRVLCEPDFLSLTRDFEIRLCADRGGGYLPPPRRGLSPRPWRLG